VAAKVSRPVVYGGLLFVAIAGFVLTTPPPDSGKGGGGLPDRSKRTAASQAGPFTEEDRTARFDRLNEGARNSFRPLVARRDAGYAGDGLAPNEFPASYTGGETGWFYTGTVVVDDVPSALVENERTGEGQFLMVGERLKRAVIAQITPTYIVVRNTSGQSVRLDLLRDRAEPGEEFDDMGVEPVRPDGPGFMTGPIRFDGQDDE